MNDKEEHIRYWEATAKDDLEAIDYLFNGKKYVQALFFAHLSLEKILKAHFIKDNEENVPPKTHNLIYLYNKTLLNLNEEDTDFLQVMNIFQLEGRYPDYLSYLHRSTLKEDASKTIQQVKTLFKCLQEKLQ